jgi:hypothetical protein
MKPIPTTDGDSEASITVPNEKNSRIHARQPTAECEYLPMDVYVDSETRHAHFRFKPELAKRSKSRCPICS